jgi:hypothetical protein
MVGRLGKGRSIAFALESSCKLANYSANRNTAVRMGAVCIGRKERRGSRSLVGNLKRKKMGNRSRNQQKERVWH